MRETDSHHAPALAIITSAAVVFFKEPVGLFFLWTSESCTDLFYDSLSPLSLLHLEYLYSGSAGSKLPS